MGVGTVRAARTHRRTSVRHPRDAGAPCRAGPPPAGPRTCWTSSTTAPTSSSRSPTASRCRVLDAIEAQRRRGCTGVRVHQMHALHDRPYLHGTVRDHLLHVSYFLSPVTRPAFHARGCELVPNHFSEVPRLLRETTKCSLVLAAASPMDRHGYFSLGTNCDYVAPFIGQVPFFLEVNARMPRTFGRNQIHVSQVAGWTEVDRPLVEVPAGADRRTSTARIAALRRRADPRRRDDPGRHRLDPERPARRAARPPRPRRAHRAALRRADRPRRAGRGHRHPQAAGAGQGGDHLRPRHPARSTTSSHENPAVELLPVDYVNDPRVIAQRGLLRLDQRHHRGRPRRPVRVGDRRRPLLVVERRPGRLRPRRHVLAATAWPSSCCRSTAAGGAVSRIRATLTPGSVVTTLKNTVDHVVTEYGVADMRGRSISQRAAALIAIADPRFRDDLEREARALGYL